MELNAVKITNSSTLRYDKKLVQEGERARTSDYIVLISITAERISARLPHVHAAHDDSPLSLAAMLQFC